MNYDKTIQFNFSYISSIKQNLIIINFKKTFKINYQNNH